MLNIFINSTDFGQAMGATFRMDGEGTIAQRRITADKDCVVNAPVYEANSANYTAKIAEFLAQGLSQKASNLGRAMNTENIRVNSLAMLIRELETVSLIESTEIITAYVPKPLLDELFYGKFKLSLEEGAPKNSYYSDFELELWRKALPLVQELFSRLNFRDIASCRELRDSQAGNNMQKERVSIYKAIYGNLLTAYREMKALKSQRATVANGTTGTADIFI